MAVAKGEEALGIAKAKLSQAEEKHGIEKQKTSFVACSFGKGGKMYYLFFYSDDPIRDAERYQAALDRNHEEDEEE